VFQASFAGTVNGDGLFMLQCPWCPEDLDLDGLIDVDDLVAVLLAWGGDGANGTDVDGDGIVGVDDLAAVLLAWGPCSD
jgi:hypothetical protein